MTAQPQPTDSGPVRESARITSLDLICGVAVLGILHSLLWYGDVLMAYAIASFFLVVLRKLPNRALISAGVVAFALSIACSLLRTRGVALANRYIPNRTATSARRRRWVR